jgi:adenylate cyclase
VFDYINHKNRVAFWLIILNLLPVLGALFGVFYWGDIVYFYWGECTLVGVVALLFHVKRLIVFAIALLVAAFVVQMTSGSLEGDLRVPFTFWSLYGVFWIGYTELARSNYYQFVRRLHPMEQFAGYLIYMGFAIAICFALTATIYGGWDIAADMPVSVYFVLLAYTVAIPTVAIGMLRIIDMIGPRQFLQFLLGTYYAPKLQDRVVMVLDMVGSSAMAEKLSPTDSLSLIARFIFDTSAAIRTNAGDVTSYTGDGLVAVWQRKHVNRVLFAIESMQARIEANRHIYEKQFGAVPKFRVGVHAGKVAVGQIGEEKLFLGLYGDVVNVAARLEQLNKETGTVALLSDAVVHSMSIRYQGRVRLVGKKEIRGREEEIEVWTLREQE